MYTLIVSSSLDPNSKSRELAAMCQKELEALDVETKLIDLATLDIPNFDNDKIFQTEVFQMLYQLTVNAEGLVLCSPIYNWGCCSELKKYIEYVGSTDDRRRGAFFDKIVTLVNSAGVPHSYMAHAPLATSLSLDFKCVLNPYNVYVHNRHWNESGLSEERYPRLKKSMKVMAELCQLLRGRRYSSGWEI